MQRIENGKSRPDSLVVLSTDSVEVKSEWLNRSELDNNQYTLHFYSSPESCLVFKGKIQSNSLDIRSDNYNGFLASKRKYVYQMAIDTNHLDAASPCSTNVSTKL